MCSCSREWLALELALHCVFLGKAGIGDGAAWGKAGGRWPCAGAGLNSTWDRKTRERAEDTCSIGIANNEGAGLRKVINHDRHRRVRA